MTDEIYEFLIGEDQVHYSFAAIAPDLLERTFTVNGFAKGWAMTGWRIGYLSGPKLIIEASSALQSQSTSNVCSFAQRGALAAIKAPKDSIKKMIDSYNSRRELLVNGLLQIKGLKITKPQGAFYAFPEVVNNSISSVDFCKLALEKVGLSMVPGLVFGEDSCVRLSCAVSNQTISEGLNRLQNIINEL